jgi:hypothetical protein
MTMECHWSWLKTEGFDGLAERVHPLGVEVKTMANQNNQTLGFGFCSAFTAWLGHAGLLRLWLESRFKIEQGDRTWLAAAIKRMNRSGNQSLFSGALAPNTFKDPKWNGSAGRSVCRRSKRCESKPRANPIGSGGLFARICRLILLCPPVVTIDIPTTLPGHIGVLAAA